MQNIQKIRDHLDELTRQYDCRLLFACESGSRAWGVSSPDSDYDVRFIYAHPMRWYLSIEDRRDTIETVRPDDIDLAGWELRKTLRLFSSCNLSLNEQIQSPTVYFSDEPFRRRLQELIPVYFNKKRAFYYYLKTADQAKTQGMQGLSIGLKRFIYVIRPLLACQWISRFGTMPPTEFQKLIEADFLPLAATEEVLDLVNQKTDRTDSAPVPLSKSLVYWMTETLDRHKEEAQMLPGEMHTASLEPLNELFVNSIAEME